MNVAKNENEDSAREILALAFDFLVYDAVSGTCVWKRSPSNRVKVGSSAGNITSEGYVSVSLGRKSYRMHRLLWLLHYGEWPNGYVDHIDGNRANNAISNLRIATFSENCGNAKGKGKGGLKGVVIDRRRPGVFRAVFRGKHLGMYASEEEAHTAYLTAAVAYWGQFARAA